VKNFINMAGPIDFTKVGLFGLWLGKQFSTSIASWTPGSIRRHGEAGFKLIKPTMDLSTNLTSGELWNDKYVMDSPQQWPIELLRSW